MLDEWCGLCTAGLPCIIPRIESCLVPGVRAAYGLERAYISTSTRRVDSPASNPWLRRGRRPWHRPKGRQIPRLVVSWHASPLERLSGEAAGCRRRLRDRKAAASIQQIRGRWPVVSRRQLHRRWAAVSIRWCPRTQGPKPLVGTLIAIRDHRSTATPALGRRPE